jgi:cytidylate kinase
VGYLDELHARLNQAFCEQASLPAIADTSEYRRFRAGGFFRNIANQYGMGIDQLNDYARKQPIIDREIDALIQQRG